VCCANIFGRITSKNPEILQRKDKRLIFQIFQIYHLDQWEYAVRVSGPDGVPRRWVVNDKRDE
jgi:hypothetical protein